MKLYYVRKAKERWAPIGIGELLTAKFAIKRRKVRTAKGFGTFRYYCENGDCVARQIDISIKDFDEQGIKPVCPLCGGPLSFTHTRMEEEVLLLKSDNRKTK